MYEEVSPYSEGLSNLEGSQGNIDTSSPGTRTGGFLRQHKGIQSSQKSWKISNQDVICEDIHNLVDVPESSENNESTQIRIQPQ